MKRGTPAATLRPRFCQFDPYDGYGTSFCDDLKENGERLPLSPFPSLSKNRMGRRIIGSHRKINTSDFQFAPIRPDVTEDDTEDDLRVIVSPLRRRSPNSVALSCYDDAGTEKQLGPQKRRREELLRTPPPLKKRATLSPPPVRLLPKKTIQLIPENDGQTALVLPSLLYLPKL
jgi:hypothetical protein